MRFTLLYLLFWLSSTVQAQLLEEKRIEITVPKRTEMSFNTIALNKNSILVYGNQKDYSKSFNGVYTYYFKWYDANLELTWESQYQIDFHYTYQSAFTDSTHVYLLFTHENKREIGLLTVQPNGEFIYRAGELPFMMDIVGFKVFSKNAFIIGRARGKDVIVDLSFFDDSIKVVPSLFDSDLDIYELSVNDKAAYAHLILKRREKGRKDYLIRRVMGNGRLVWEKSVEFQDGQHPIEMRHIFHNQDAYVIGLAGNDRNSFYPHGFFLMKVSEEKQAKEWIKVQDFSEFNNFFSFHQSPRKRLKAKNKVRKLYKEGKTFPNRYRYAMHEPIIYKDLIILVGEAYQLTYSSPSQLNTLSPGGVYFNTHFLFNRNNAPAAAKFDFLHGTIAAFDKQGNLKWDAAIPIERKESYSASPGITVCPQKDQILIFQPYDRYINLRVFRKDTIFYDNKKIPYQKKYIPELKEDDTEHTVRAYESKVSYLDEEHFLIEGTYNPEEERIFSANNTVFYLAKVKFVPPAPSGSGTSSRKASKETTP